MVAPKAPEGGWKKWFLEHPHQRTKYPILRATNVWAAYEGSPSTPSTAAVHLDYEYVEMWWNGSECRVYASLNGQPPDWLYFGTEASDQAWSLGVTDLFDHCVAKEPTPTPPEPSGSGWDDFDWSR